MDHLSRRLLGVPSGPQGAMPDPAPHRGVPGTKEFNKMTKNEKLAWLFCAYEKLKEGDDKHLIIYKEKNGDIPNYNQFLKLWGNRGLEK